MKIYVKLSGTASRYNLDGQVYEKGKVYGLPEARAKMLLKRRDHFHRPFFSELSASEVEELTGERVQPEAKPEPAPAPKQELEVSDETDAEAQKRADDAQKAAEAAAIDSEDAITDDEVEVVGANAPTAPTATLEEGEFTDI